MEQINFLINKYKYSIDGTNKFFNK